jgi:hypothetical protein
LPLPSVIFDFLAMPQLHSSSRVSSLARDSACNVRLLP